MAQAQKPKTKSKKKKDLEEELKRKEEQLQQKEERIGELEKSVQEIREELKKHPPAEADQAKGKDEIQESIKSLNKTVEKLASKIEEDKEKTLNEAKAAVIAIANDQQVAKKVGHQTGINVATLQKQCERAVNGEITYGEVLNMLDNAWNIIRGFFTGSTAFDEVIKGLSSKEDKGSDQVSDALGGDYR